MTDRLFALLHFIVVCFVLLLLASAAVGCWRAGDPGGEGGNAGLLHSAEATWAAVKPSCSAYHYISTTSSVFGSCAETTIHVANDQPVGRSFVDYTTGGCGGGDAAPAESWSEVGAQEVGTHGDGAPALTVEQLFAACETSLAQDPNQNTFIFGVGSDGVPTMCGTTPKNCVDDCYQGFRLSDFACGPWTFDAGPGQ